MVYESYSNNNFELIGRVSRINDIAKGKVASIFLAVDMSNRYGNGRKTEYIPVKCFMPERVNEIREGNPFVMIKGHMAINAYEKDGVKKVQTDLIADTIAYLEAKSVVQERIARKRQAAEEEYVYDMNLY